MRDLGQHVGGIPVGGLPCMGEPGSPEVKHEAELVNGGGAVEGSRTLVWESDYKQPIGSFTHRAAHSLVHVQRCRAVCAGHAVCQAVLSTTDSWDPDLKILESCK